MSGIIGGTGSKSGVLSETEGGSEVGSYTNVLMIGGGTSTNDAAHPRLYYSRSGKFCTVWGYVTSTPPPNHTNTGNIRMRLPFPVRTMAEGNGRGSAHALVTLGGTEYTDRELRLDEGLSGVYFYALVQPYVSTTYAEVSCCFTYPID